MAELSGFEVLGLLKEIGSTLRGTYVNNIFSAGSSQLIRLRKPDSEDFWLVVSPKKGVWISGEVNERADTTEFTSKLRGELERARLAGATQADLDRVFELQFEKEEGRTMIVELMPPGNIIVTDSEGRVVLAEDEVRSKSRRVVRGARYQPPLLSRVSPALVTPDEVKEMLGREKSAGAAIGRHVALPRKYVTVLLARLGLNEDSPATLLQGKEEEVAQRVREMVEEAKEQTKPCVARTSKGDEMFAIDPTGFEVTQTAGSLSELCDRLFLEEATTGVEAPSSEDGRRKELDVTISRLRAESESLTSAASSARVAAKEAGAGSPERALATLKSAGVPAARLPTSPAAIASAVFDHAKELERRASESLEAAERLEKKRTRAAPPGGKRLTPLPKRKQEWFEKFRWFVTSGGRLAVGGRDAQSNTLLIKRHLDEGDVVYHADLFGSPFFVLKDGTQQSELETLEVSQATVSFSSGWKTGLGAADAYWVLKDQVSGTAESGEYLAKGSFVVRGKKNFVRHAMLQVAVGLDGSGRVMAGPESAVAKSCRKYVVLTPHREKASDTAKKVQKELAQAGVEPVRVALDDIVRALPSGGGKIVRRKSSAESGEKP